MSSQRKIGPEVPVQTQAGASGNTSKGHCDVQGLQDACSRQQASIAEALPPTITHMKSGAQVDTSQCKSSCSVSPAHYMSIEGSLSLAPD